MAMDYTDTLNLPKTSFPMRANLPAREPETLAYWDRIDLYHALQEGRENAPTFLLHDGPPFSNGDIHMGTALNKILKDFVNKSKVMQGYRVPYVPGWDNHGMPIESAIIRKNKLNRKRMGVPEFRNACRDFAARYVEIQKAQFVRLGVTADWDRPYLTMDPSFEARETRVFGDMYRKGYIYKGMKPVHWCPKCETALAEAEIEYQTDPCQSIYVRFRVEDGRDVRPVEGAETYFLIWTTTPWTLPGNLAIAVNPEEDYVWARVEDGSVYIVAAALCARVMEAGRAGRYEIVATAPGRALTSMTARHPFLDRLSAVIPADYVTMDAGTGCVHTAPGFGADDFVACSRQGIKAIVPVDDRGYQTAEAGPFAGMYYADSNEAILEALRASGALFACETVSHEYPHCWRCKDPVIFRATPQWFCSVDAFRDEAIAACRRVTWIPAWGEERMARMLEERSDWCISRQRHWGLPIPVFTCASCGRTICTPETIARVSELFGRYGSNCWFERDVRDLLPEGFACPDCGGRTFTKETDTLDGWFDSGSSHLAVLESREGLGWPADLYLEGGDQYRGWFQSSLLTAVGAQGGDAPYRTVLTHGWVVDGEGRTMHKSLGNGVDPNRVVQRYGADLVRLWAASGDYHADVRCSDDLFRQLSEVYRKIRNTARILLANLGDFDPDASSVPPSALRGIDRWILSRTNGLVRVCREGYGAYDFHAVSRAIANFCTNDLSKLYVDITKDRLYTEAAASAARRAAQTAMYETLSAVTRLAAPILSFTAEEIWQHMPHGAGDRRESVFLNPLPAYDPEREYPDEAGPLNRLFDLRDDVMKALEQARAAGMIGKSLDAKVTIYPANPEQRRLLDSLADRLAALFITSGARVGSGEAPEGAFADTASGLRALVEPADGVRCDRCWTYTTEGTAVGEGYLCPRCRRVVSGL